MRMVPSSHRIERDVITLFGYQTHSLNGAGRAQACPVEKARKYGIFQIAKAKPEIVAATRDKLAELSEQLKLLEKHLSEL